jgi:very-short-patch-repair endonuclease
LCCDLCNAGYLARPRAAVAAQSDQGRAGALDAIARPTAWRKFRRQYRIGPYIVDFCCLERGLVIELDGGQHSEQMEADRKRTTYIPSRGFRMLRFWNDRVLKETYAVLDQILCELKLSDRER